MGFLIPVKGCLPEFAEGTLLDDLARRLRCDAQLDLLGLEVVVLKLGQAVVNGIERGWRLQGNVIHVTYCNV
ncbi:MAG: hypothetical protein IH825_06520 [Candidatus Marinimicrobia bacterium]|nr:hypothetical protein [Candidatus Neomarinimicrobiota bacterium]